MIRKALVTCLAAFAVLLGMTLVSPSASATLPLLQCTGTSSFTYDPGLTNTQQTVSIEGEENATACEGTLQPPSLTFKASYTGTLTGSCTQPLGSGSGDQTFTWSTGETSEWHWTFLTSSSVNGTLQAIAVGPITDGKYEGSQLRQVVTFLTSDLAACSSPQGLTEVSGPSQWTFSPI